MCKCCQSIFDSCYWHCYGKWDFDEEIALYEDESPAEKKKDSHAMDNLAYFNSVQMMASRSVIITQPTPSKPSLGQLEVISTPNKDNKEIHISVVSPSTSNDTINTSSNLSLPDGDTYIQITETPTIENCQRNNKYRKNSYAETVSEKRFITPNSERVRKKSLKERRNSTADLTLDLSCTYIEFHEIPVIRANSMPKHYLNTTPEYNPFVESTVLTNPILPQSSTPQYDLKSVVQFENELENANAKQARILRSQSRIAHIKRKMVPTLIKKASTKSLPDTINHI